MKREKAKFYRIDSGVEHVIFIFSSSYQYLSYLHFHLLLQQVQKFTISTRLKFCTQNKSNKNAFLPLYLLDI